MTYALKGYRMKLLMPRRYEPERRAAMRAHGAELILVTKRAGNEGTRFTLAMFERGEGKLLDQFNNPDNPLPLTTPPPARNLAAKRRAGNAFCLQHGQWHHYRRVAFSARAGKAGQLSLACSRKRAAVFREFAAGLRNICRHMNASLVDEVLDIHQCDAEKHHA